jgi:hypothetical protein
MKRQERINFFGWKAVSSNKNQKGENLVILYSFPYDYNSKRKDLKNNEKRNKKGDSCIGSHDYDGSRLVCVCK